MKYDYFMTKQYKHLEDFVSHNLIPNLLPESKDNTKDWNNFMILEVVSD